MARIDAKDAGGAVEVTGISAADALAVRTRVTPVPISDYLAQAVDRDRRGTPTPPPLRALESLACARVVVLEG